MPDELRHTVQRSNRFFNIGVFLHNPFAPWRRGRLVLVGACALRSKGSKLSAAGLEGKKGARRGGSEREGESEREGGEREGRGESEKGGGEVKILHARPHSHSHARTHARQVS